MWRNVVLDETRGGGAGQDGQLRDAQYERTVALTNQSENGGFINQS